MAFRDKSTVMTDNGSKQAAVTAGALFNLVRGRKVVKLNVAMSKGDAVRDKTIEEQ